MAFKEPACEEHLTDAAFNPYHFGSAKNIQARNSTPMEFSPKPSERRVPAII